MKHRSSNANHPPKTSQRRMTKAAKGQSSSQLILNVKTSKTTKKTNKKVPLWTQNADEAPDEKTKQSILKAQKGRRERDRKKAEDKAKDIRIEELEKEGMAKDITITNLEKQVSNQEKLIDYLTGFILKYFHFPSV